MAKDTKTDKTPAKQSGETSSGPAFNIVGQYIRDLSFENPGAPGSSMGGGATPTFEVGINVNVKKQADEVYAVELTVNAKAQRDNNMMFNIELVYGGVFRVRNVEENQLPPLLMIECPRFLFPFARQVLANVTQAGGFPPLLMEPVDFLAIYQQNLSRAAEATAPAGGSGKPN